MKYDVIVVGGGHAGIEASLAASRCGCDTALFTMDVDSIGRMSCNPAIGGTAKGHLVREIDALGGEMGKLADATGIHFRMLNKSKGPAVWSPRCQNDRDWYSREAKRRVLAQEGLTVVSDTIQDIVVSEGRLHAVVCSGGEIIRCNCLVICTGTFLNAVMHTGGTTRVGGRFEEPSSTGLSIKLAALGFKTGRLKTGTPPRLHKETIDFGVTAEQPPDQDPAPFSYQNDRISNRQISMYLTHTNEETHNVLRTGFGESPLFTGRIKGIGPRYCPSIEDKLNRFPDRQRHQIFLEPEGYDTDVVYMNGFSSSLPEEVQRRAVATIRGLEHCKVLRAGYAVEYDYFPPYQVEHTLETKLVDGLFFAGQINGTSGYEEAAAQGLVAGINAALKVKRAEPLILRRSDSYVGVMIDDLINKGTEEPYRMFTSRAEYRLVLRQDNADSRLMRKGHAVGLIPPSAIDRLNEKESRISRAKESLREGKVTSREVNDLLLARGTSPLESSDSLEQLLKRPEITLRDLMGLECVRRDERIAVLAGDRESLERVEVEVKYEGYLNRQDAEIEQFRRHEEVVIPAGFDFTKVRSLSNEGKEKLQRVKPRSIGQASRISGVTAADVSVLLVMLLQ